MIVIVKLKIKKKRNNSHYNYTKNNFHEWHTKNKNKNHNHIRNCNHNRENAKNFEIPILSIYSKVGVNRRWSFLCKIDEFRASYLVQNGIFLSPV